MARTGTSADVGGNASESAAASVATAVDGAAGSTVNVDEKSSPEAFAYEVELDSKADKGHVVYAGDASLRVISSADWESLGIKGKDEVRWGFANDFRVPVSEFTKAQMDYLRRDGRFAVPGGN